MRAALHAAGPKVVHIFLCEYMRDRFGQTYWKPERSVIISNSAFVSPQANSITSVGAPLRIGLLSNLNREKGLYLFLDVLRATRNEGLNIHGILAGPVQDPGDRLAIDAAQEELGDALTYAGPLYGDKKLGFFASIDVFVFPTTYVNEAQPTVLYEALAAGNLVVTYDRGCIASQVTGEGLVIPPDHPFVPRAAAWLRELKVGVSRDSRESIALRMAGTHRSERAKARALLNECARELSA
ncbi:glycosyltransferase involved in cell wall biosynthesis [Bradyrhizobium sp. LB7.2]